MSFYENTVEVAKQAKILRETNQVAFAESIQGKAIERIKELIHRKARTGSEELRMDIWQLGDVVRLDDVEVGSNTWLKTAIDSLIAYFRSIGFEVHTVMPEDEIELFVAFFRWSEQEIEPEVVVETPVDTSEILVSAEEYTKLLEDSQKLQSVRENILGE